MVWAAVIAALATIFGFVVNGVAAGASILNTFFQMLPDKLKHIVLAGIMTGGGVFWLETTKALGFKLVLWGLDLTVAPMAVAIGLVFAIMLPDIFNWYNYWLNRR